MSRPFAPVGASLPPSPNPIQKDMDWGANALAAPRTPGQRLPQVDKSRVDPALKQAAEGMEAMFLDYLMKTMRQTVPKSDMSLDSPAAKIYQGMLDSETAQIAARTGGVGLADQIIAYMEASRYNLRRPERAPEAQTAGDLPTRDQ